MLNIAVSLRLLPSGKLSGCLKAVTLFSCSIVSELFKLRLFVSHVHLRPVLKIKVEGEDT